MRSTFIAAGALAAAALGFAPAAAEAQAYVSGSIGYMGIADQGTGVDLGAGEVKAEYDAGWAANIAAGYKFNFGLRLEGELGYGRSGIDQLSDGSGSVKLGGGNLDLFTASVNAFYDIKTGTAFTPYLGGGIGYEHSSSDDVTFRGTTIATGATDNSFMWLLEAGVAIDVAPHWAVVPAYRFVQFQNADSGSDNNQAHIFKIGLRYSF